MAIGFGSSATGTKTVTTGTSFTITLTVPAGNMIVVSVLSSSTSNNVTSITDVGGNVYNFKSSNNMATFTNEIWITKSHCVASGGTITVNVTTGFVAIGIASYYSGVDSVDVPVAAGGSSSPITTGAVTLRDSSSWVFMGGGMAAANAFTASSGSLRNQTTVSTFSALTIDSNGAASPVTCSATMTAASWGLIRVFLRAGNFLPSSAPADTQDIPGIPDVPIARAEPLTFVQVKRLAPVPVTAPFIQTSASRGYAIDEEDVNPGPKAPAFVTVAGHQVPYASVFAARDYAVAGEDVNPGYIAPAIPSPALAAWSPQSAAFSPFNDYAYAEEDINPGSVTTLVPSVSGWSSVDSADYIQKTVSLRYAPTDFTSPVRVLPSAIFPSMAAWNSTDSTDYIQKVVPLNYPKIQDSPLHGAITISITPSTAAWQSTDSADYIQKTVSLKYAPTDFTSPVRVLPSIVPPSAAAWNSTDSTDYIQKVVSQTYSPSVWNAPDRVFPAVPSITGWSSTVGQNSVVLRYAPPDFVNQLFPTEVLTPLGYLPYDANRSLVLKYAPSDDITRPPFIPGVFVSGWFGAVAQNALLQKYATPTFDAPFRIPVSFVSGWFSTDGQRSVISRYAPSDDLTKPPFIAPAISVSGWQSFIAQNALLQKFAPSDDLTRSLFVAPVQFISGWASTIGQNALLQRFALTDFVSQVFPTLAQLPRLSQLAEPGVNAQPQKFASPTWDAPPKFGLTLAALQTIAGWLGTDGQKSVLLKYAPSDYVSQFYPTLTLLPRLSGLAEPGVNAQPQKFAAPAWDAPPKFGLTIAALQTIAGWFGTDGQKSVVLNYAPSDFVSQLYPSLATLPILRMLAELPNQRVENRYAASDFVNQLFPTLFSVSIGYFPYLAGASRRTKYSQSIEDVNPGAPFLVNPIPWTLAIPGVNAQPQKFASPTWEAPPKFGLTIAALQTIAGWFGTDGQKSVILNYAPSDYVSQIFPTLSLLPRLSGLAEPGINAQPQRFALPTWDAPPKFGLTIAALQTIAGWFGTDGANAVRLKYAPSDYVSQVSPTLATLPILRMLAELPNQRVENRYAIPDFVNQLFPTLVTISTGYLPYIAGASATAKYFQSIEDVNPGTPPVVTPVSSWQSFIAQNALLQKFAPPDDLTRALFVTTVPSALTISGWSGTMGQNAVQYRFAQPDFVSQLFPTLAQLPRLLSDIAFLPPNALPQKYAAPTWEAPAKFGLIIAAPLTLPGWTSTIGQNAVVLRYALPDFVNQVRPTLATLPYLTSELTKPADPIVLLRYAGTAYDAPTRFSIPIVPSISGWFGTDGQRAVQLVYASPDFVTQYSPTRVVTPVGYLQYEGNRQVQLRYAPTDFITQYSPTLVLASLGYLQYPGNPQVQLKYAPTDFITRIQVPPPVSFAVDFGPRDRPANPPTFAPGDIFKIPDKIFPFVAYPTIESWTPTVGQQSVQYRFATPDFVTQIRPTLATLPASASFLDFIPPHAQPQKYATPEWFINQLKPTLARLPIILEGLAFIPPHAQPQHFAVPDFTAPAKFGIIIPPTAIIVKGVIFYRVIAVPMIVDEQINKNVIVYKVYAMSTNLQQRLVRTVVIDKNTGQVLSIDNIDP